MKRVLLLTALTTLLGAALGCAHSDKQAAAVMANPVMDRRDYVDQRSQELIRRGAPKEAALAKASGEWFNALLAEDRRAEERKRAQQRGLDKTLAEMSRDRDGFDR